SSWFGEQGTRLFYVVPRSLTDAVLPLTIEPRPDEILRVLVGRMEILSQEDESRMLKVVSRSAQERAAREGRQALAAGEEVRPPVGADDHPLLGIVLSRRSQPAAQLRQLDHFAFERNRALFVDGEDDVVGRLRERLSAADLRHRDVEVLFVPVKELRGRHEED